jgi:hypothetical protein
MTQCNWIRLLNVSAVEADVLSVFCLGAQTVTKPAAPQSSIRSPGTRSSPATITDEKVPFVCDRVSQAHTEAGQTKTVIELFHKL